MTRSRSRSRPRSRSRKKAVDEVKRSEDIAKPTTVKSAWMDPSVRAFLISLRPWSFPAFAVPIAIAGAVIYNETGVHLLRVSYVLCFFIVLSLHAAANMFNTYFDFKSGADTKKHADDRGIVDGLVSPRTVFATAIACSALGVVSAAALAWHIGRSQTALRIATIVALALALSFFYTADPFSLKRHALGDLTVFLMFGPMLM